MRLPTAIQVSFAHAALAHLAATADADLLHVKGKALHEILADPGRAGTDADVLARPRHLPPLVRALRAHGWTVQTGFDAGSPFGHAMTFVHPTWGYADVHRRFPGITVPDDDAFDRLWRDRRIQTIAGVDCVVPGIAAQRLILVLNAARGSSYATTDVASAWTSATATERSEVRALVGQLDAEVAFAAGIGELDQHRDRREYDLWRITTRGGSRSAEWRARIKAAPTTRERLRLACLAPLVNTEHLAVQLGRAPDRGELVREFIRRIRRAGGEISKELLERLTGSRR